MKKGWIIAIAIVAVLVIWFATGYNSLVKQEEGVKTAWSQVENQYQRRSDLIPNLVNTVKGYASHESETLEGVVAARARATQTTIDADNLTPEAIEKYQAAQGELTAALGRLLMIQENYPDLKANQNFCISEAITQHTMQMYNFYSKQPPRPTNIGPKNTGFPSCLQNSCRTAVLHGPYRSRHRTNPITRPLSDRYNISV